MSSRVRKKSDQEISLTEAEFAWPHGDQAGALDFQHDLSMQVASEISRALTASFPPARTAGARYVGLRAPDGPVGCYRLSTREGSWFVRVSSRLRNSVLRKSIIDYLIEHGININPLYVAGEKLHWEGRTYSIDVSCLVEGRHFNGLTQDLSHVAHTLSACHRALAQFPRAHEIRAAAAVRYQRLREVCEHVSHAIKSGTFGLFGERASWAVTHRDWLSEMVNQFDQHLNERPDAQCVHGEIHPGNVLFRASDDKAVLIDFEESTHLFMPPAWDLAFLVQRFCLKDKPSPAVARERLAVIAEGYGGSLPKLATMMRQAAWFTLATILDLRATQSVVTPIAEYDKFVELERQTLTYEGVV